MRGIIKSCASDAPTIPKPSGEASQIQWVKCSVQATNQLSYCLLSTPFLGQRTHVFVT